MGFLYKASCKHGYYYFLSLLLSYIVHLEWILFYFLFLLTGIMWMTMANAAVHKQAKVCDNVIEIFWVSQQFSQKKWKKKKIKAIILCIIEKQYHVIFSNKTQSCLKVSRQQRTFHENKISTTKLGINYLIDILLYF